MKLFEIITIFLGLAFLIRLLVSYKGPKVPLSMVFALDISLIFLSLLNLIILYASQEMHFSVPMFLIGFIIFYIIPSFISQINSSWVKWYFLLLISLILFFMVYSLMMLRQNGHFDLTEAKKFNNIVPMAIVGGGPAGLSAAVYSARARIPTVVFAGPKIGGELLEASYVENWPGKEKMTGAQIAEDVRKQAESFGASIVPLKVQNINLSRWPFTLTISNGDIVHPLALLITTGGSQRLPEIPGVKEYWGKGIGICTICDAPYDKGKDVVIVGGGDAAADKALQVAAFAKQVTILVRGSKMHAATVIQEYLKNTKNITIEYEKEPKAVLGQNGRVSGIVILDAKTGKETTRPIQSIYFALGFKPNVDLIKDSLRLNKNGYVHIHCGTHLTSVPGVFAGGNIADDRYQKAGYAAGAGIGAALDAIDFLNDLGFNPAHVDEWKEYLYTVPVIKNPIQAVENEAALTKMLADNKRVFLIFHLKLCPVCKELMHLLEQFDQKLPDKNIFASADIEDLSNLVKKYSIEQTPTIIVFSEGKEVQRLTRENAHEIEQELKKLISEQK